MIPHFIGTLHRFCAVSSIAERILERKRAPLPSSLRQCYRNRRARQLAEPIRVVRTANLLGALPCDPSFCNYRNHARPGCDYRL